MLGEYINLMIKMPSTHLEINLPSIQPILLPPARLQVLPFFSLALQLIVSIDNDGHSNHQGQSSTSCSSQDRRTDDNHYDSNL